MKERMVRTDLGRITSHQVYNSFYKAHVVLKLEALVMNFVGKIYSYALENSPPACMVFQAVSCVVTLVWAW
jgi:hypothetical protein